MPVKKGQENKPQKEVNKINFYKDLPVTDRNSQNKYVFQVADNFIKNFCSEK